MGRRGEQKARLTERGVRRAVVAMLSWSMFLLLESFIALLVAAA